MDFSSAKTHLLSPKYFSVIALIKIQRSDLVSEGTLAEEGVSLVRKRTLRKRWGKVRWMRLCSRVRAYSSQGAFD